MISLAIFTQGFSNWGNEALIDLRMATFNNEDLHSANTFLPAGIDTAVLYAMVHVSRCPSWSVAFAVGVVSVVGVGGVEGAWEGVWARHLVVVDGVPLVLVVVHPPPLGCLALPVCVTLVLPPVLLVERPQGLHHSVDLEDDLGLQYVWSVGNRKGESTKEEAQINLASLPVLADKELTLPHLAVEGKSLLMVVLMIILFSFDKTEKSPMKKARNTYLLYLPSSITKRRTDSL